MKQKSNCTHKDTTVPVPTIQDDLNLDEFDCFVDPDERCDKTKDKTDLEVGVPEIEYDTFDDIESLNNNDMDQKSSTSVEELGVLVSDADDIPAVGDDVSNNLFVDCPSDEGCDRNPTKISSSAQSDNIETLGES